MSSVAPTRRMMPRARPTGTSAHPMTRTAVVAPALLAVVYGLWAAGMQRSSDAPVGSAGPITAGNVLFGIVTGVIVGAVAFGLHRVSHALPREMRAMAWGVFAAVAIGFLYSLGGATVLRATTVALLVGTGVAAALFYRYYTTE